MKTRLRQLFGRSLAQDTELLLIIRVKDKYYPLNDHNHDIIRSYWKTGDKKQLTKLESELEA